MSNKKEDESGLNLDFLPYPAQATLIRHLYSCSDDLLNLGTVFQGLAAVTELRKTTWIFDKIFPILASYLRKTDAFKCRLVCHTWMQVVDSFVQNLGFVEPRYSDPKLSLSEPLRHWTKDGFRPTSCRIQNANDAKSFIEKVGTYPGNPFITRSVQINDQNDPQHWQEVSRFLERCGNDIWKLRLGCYCAYSKATVIIRDLLVLVPNVKLLSIEFNGIDPYDLTEEEEVEVHQDLEETPFPPLPNLTHLDWSMCREFYDAAMPQYSQHLVHVSLMDSEFMDTFDSRVHGTFPNMKSLVIHINHEDELAKLRELTSPLKTATIQCSERISLRTYLSTLHHFARTLESFNVEYEEDEMFPDLSYFQADNQHDPAQNAELEFPVLKCVRIENPDPTESFDALLSLKPGPECLKIQTYISDWMEHYRDYQRPLFKKMSGEAVEIHGYLEKMQKSRIWTLMSQLQTCDVKAYNPRNRKITKVYKRSEVMRPRNNVS